MIQICLSKATNLQLLTILQEEVPMDLKYEVCRTLQERRIQSRWKEEMTTTLVLMWSKGKSVSEIAKELRVNAGRVGEQIDKLNLWRVRLNELRKTL